MRQQLGERMAPHIGLRRPGGSAATETTALVVDARANTVSTVIGAEPAVSRAPKAPSQNVPLAVVAIATNAGSISHPSRKAVSMRFVSAMSADTTHE
jgi:hypothetical protein